MERSRRLRIWLHRVRTKSVKHEGRSFRIRGLTLLLTLYLGVFTPRISVLILLANVRPSPAKVYNMSNMILLSYLYNDGTMHSKALSFDPGPNVT